MTNPKNLIEAIRLYSNEQTCLDMVAEMRWAAIKVTNIGKLPIQSAELAGHIEIFPSAEPANLKDRSRASINLHSFIFPNDGLTFHVELFDEESGKPRGLTDKELSSPKEGTSYMAVFGLDTYKDDLGSHWLRFCDRHGYSVNGGTASASGCAGMNEVGDGVPKEKK